MRLRKKVDEGHNELTTPLKSSIFFWFSLKLNEDGGASLPSQHIAWALATTSSIRAALALRLNAQSPTQKR